MLVTFSSGSVPTARVLPADDCTFSVSPTRVDVGAAAESGVVRVETQPGCSWTVTADVGWIRLTEATAGPGSGDIPYSVSELVPSWSVPSRRGRLKVRWNTPTLGQNVLVTQIGAPCNAALLADRGPSSSETFGGGGGGGHLIVWTADGGSGSGPWFVAKAPDWVTFTSPFLGLFSWGDSVTFFAIRSWIRCYDTRNPRHPWVNNGFKRWNSSSDLWRLSSPQFPMRTGKQDPRTPAYWWWMTTRATSSR